MAKKLFDYKSDPNEATIIDIQNFGFVKKRINSTVL